MTTTRDIMHMIRNAPKAPGPKPQSEVRVLGGAVEQVSKSAFFERVKMAREAGKQLGLLDRAKAGDEVSEKTAGTYAATVTRRMDLNAATGGQLMSGVSAPSWHATKAALSWGAARAWRDEMRAGDRAQKAGDMAASAAHVERAIRAAQVMASIERAERPEPTKRRATKRATLPKADGWQARIFEAATSAQRPAVALLWATGCRPAEVELGVDVIRDSKGRLVVRIPGAKVHDGHGAGQPKRLLLIDESTDAGRALSAALGSSRQITIQRAATRLNKDFSAIREKVGGKASPYSMRHQVAADLKATFGPDGAETVAAAMGHRTTRSQGRYGSVQQAKGGGAIKAAQATHTVKETRPSRRLSASEKVGPETNCPSL